MNRIFYSLPLGDKDGGSRVNVNAAKYFVHAGIEKR
jgi:hypothetical protein